MGSFTPKLELRQGLSLVMTPQLQQAIKLLQYSNIELAAYVEDELIRNPLLERDESERQEQQFTDTPEIDKSAAGPATENADGVESLDSSLNDNMNLGAKEDAIDIDPDVRFEDSPSENPTAAPDAGAGSLRDWGSGSGGSFEDGEFSLENMLARVDTLSEHLRTQLQIEVRDPTDLIIGAALIDLVEDDGYLRTDLSEVCENIGVELEDVHKVLAVCQTFDPSGVMARDLKECMAIQLREKDRYDPAMAALIENLELLANKDFARLRDLCGVDNEDITEMIGELRALDPKPGSVFINDAATPIIPDVFVTENPAGGWRVDLNSDTLPRVLMNNRYHAQVVSKIRDKKDKAYLTECMNDANWLVKSLDQRARTILKVSSEIVRQQDGFLAHGVNHLKPLNLKVIAEAIEMHESTISRVTANKFMSCPRGLFELKFFFTVAIQATDGGDAHSAESVRHKIRELVEAESPKKILSDDKLVVLLKGQGIDIARRTVAKYREAMRIPSSVQRRREKRMALS